MREYSIIAIMVVKTAYCATLLKLLSNPVFAAFINEAKRMGSNFQLE